MDQDLPEGLRKCTREGFPLLWGQAELLAYADIVADRLGKPRPHRGRFWSWQRIEGFPKPVATLGVGSIWLAKELAPFIEHRLAMERFRTTAIDESTRAAVMNDKGTLTARGAATKHGISKASVSRIWRGERL